MESFYMMKNNKILDNIKSVHMVNGKKVIVLKEQDVVYKPRTPKTKLKEHYRKLRNAK